MLKIMMTHQTMCTCSMMTLFCSSKRLLCLVGAIGARRLAWVALMLKGTDWAICLVRSGQVWLLLLLMMIIHVNSLLKLKKQYPVPKPTKSNQGRRNLMPITSKDYRINKLKSCRARRFSKMMADNLTGRTLSKSRHASQVNINQLCEVLLLQIRSWPRNPISWGLEIGSNRR